PPAKKSFPPARVPLSIGRIHTTVGDTLAHPVAAFQSTAPNVPNGVMFRASASRPALIRTLPDAQFLLRQSGPPAQQNSTHNSIGPNHRALAETVRACRLVTQYQYRALPQLKTSRD